MTLSPLLGWYPNSGIRERLALLAVMGPTLDPREWRYEAGEDVWFSRRQIARIRVSQEGTASLEILYRTHGLTRADAMALIGYPEER
jgi:hypothetical protein